MTTRTEQALMASSSHSTPRRSEAKTVQWLLIIVIIAIAATAFNANSQEGYTQNGYLYIGNGDHLGKYRLDGSIVNASLVSGVGAQGLAISGTNIYVSNSDSDLIGKYSTSGKTINASLITKTAFYFGVAVAGTNLFVENFDGYTVSEYSTSGTPINTNYYPPLGQPATLAISGTNLFVANQGGAPNTGTIGEYTMSGATVNAALIKGPSFTYGIAVADTNLFVSSFAKNTVAEYTTSGATNNASFLSGLNGPTGLAILGTNLFVCSGGPPFGSVGEYTISGQTINPALIVGPPAFGIAITLVPQLYVEPAVANQTLLFYPTGATNWVLQASTNSQSASPTWVTVTNGTPMTCIIVTNNAPAGFFQLAPTQ